MARLLCIYDSPDAGLETGPETGAESGLLPPEPEDFTGLMTAALAVGVAGWLVPTTYVASASQLQVPPLAWWLRDCSSSAQRQGLAFALLLRADQALTPGQENELADQLQPWLRHNAALHWQGRPILILESPDQLSHPRFGGRRLRRGLAPPEELAFPDLQLLAMERPGQEAFSQEFDGRVEAPLQALPCQRLGDDWDYESFLFHAHHRRPSRSLIRTVVPHPHGPAQRGGQLRRFRHATAINYREWLRQVEASTDLIHGQDEPGLLICSSWEGHKLWGDGLTRDGLSMDRSSPGQQTTGPVAPPQQGQSAELEWRQDGDLNSNHLAVVVHGFYLDLLEDLLARIHSQRDQLGIDLFVSTPRAQLEAAEALLKRAGGAYRLAGVENRGRDMLPFLHHLLPAVIQAGHPILVKLHTKRSPHLKKGANWAEHLLQSLLGTSRLALIREAFSQDPRLGLLAPAGSLMPCTVCLAENVEKLKEILKNGDIDEERFLSYSFAAGSMMALRTVALAPLLDRALEPGSFSDESGQTDGTLAHAMERVIGAVVQNGGFRVEALPGQPSPAGQFGYGWARC